MTVRVSARDGVGMGVPSGNWSTFESGKSYQNSRLGFMKLIRTRGVGLAGPLHKVDPASAFSRERASLT
jgi:hypothetical protein